MIEALRWVERVRKSPDGAWYDTTYPVLQYKINGEWIDCPTVKE
jgi:hypothetical protein